MPKRRSGRQSTSPYARNTTEAGADTDDSQTSSTAVNPGPSGAVSQPQAETTPIMAESREEDEKLFPAVFMYGPCTVTGLEAGAVKYWCRCGLSRIQPWCDGSHKDTGIKPMKWIVPHTQTKFQICACKYTKSAPICDATHTNLPLEVIDRQTTCSRKTNHVKDCKLCTGCGWVPDF